MVRPRCTCGCVHETHRHMHRRDYCGRCVSCNGYQNVALHRFYFVALSVLAFLIPFGGALWIYLFITVQAPIPAVIVAIISLGLFKVYRDAASKRYDTLRNYRRLRMQVEWLDRRTSPIPRITFMTK